MRIFVHNAHHILYHDHDDTDNLRAKEVILLDLPHKSIFTETVTIGEREIENSKLKWFTFHDFTAENIYSTVQERVFPFIKNLHNNRMCIDLLEENCRLTTKLLKKK